MDFYKLSRKQLQALCKKNKIPANITNLAMAEALAALHQAEGLDEILIQVEADAEQFEEKKVVGTPDVHHTGSRTSTRRKDANVPVTPAMPSSRRRAPSISTRRKREVQIQMPEDEKNGGQGKPIDVPTTPVAPTTRTRAYNTRRSVRLLEKNLSRMNLLDTEDIGLVKIDDVSEDISNVSQQTEISAETEEKKTNELEVTSQEKNTECELGSGSENAAGVSLLPAEPEDSSLKLEGSSGTYNDSNEVCDKLVGKAVHANNEAEAGLLFSSEDSCDSMKQENKICLGTKRDASTEVCEGASLEVTNHDVAAFSLSVEILDDTSMEVTGQDNVGLLPMSSVSMTGNQGGNDSAEISAVSNEVSEDASTKVIDREVFALTVEVPVNASVGATDQHIAGLLPMSSVSNNSVILEGLVACNTDKHEGNDSAEISSLSVESEDDSMEATDQDVPAFSVDVTDQDIAAFSVDVTALSMEVSDDASKEATDQDIAGSLSVSSVCCDSVSLHELVTCNTDKHDGNDSAEISDTPMSLLSCNANTLVDDAIPEEIAIPKQESSVSVETMKHVKSSSTEVPIGKIDEAMLSTMTVAPIYEQPKGESHCPGQSGPKDVTDERIQGNKIYKENTSTYENLSIRELKKMLKNLTPDCKSNGKNNNVAKEVDRKRPALQVLPENRMTAAVTENDG